MDDFVPNTPSTSPIAVGWQSNMSLGACMLQIFESSLWTDVTFRCKDQNKEDSKDRIRAHKIVLAARSPVFQAMFFGQQKDIADDIYLDDIESSDFCAFLRSLYRDDAGENINDAENRIGTADEEVNVNNTAGDSQKESEYISEELDDELESEELESKEKSSNNARKDVEDLISILKIANKYQVQTIEDKCAKQLSRVLTEEHACILLDIGLLYNNAILIESASEFVDVHAEQVLKSDGFIEMSKECLLHIIKSDTFFASESNIFERVMLWAEKKCGSKDGERLRQTIGDAFFYIRTPTMSCTNFIRCTKRRGIYTLHETEDILESIEGVATTMDFSELCNSNIRRVPLNFNVDFDSNFERTYSVNPVSLDISIQFRPTRDVFMKGFRLSETIDVGMYMERKFGRNFSRCNIRGFSLSLLVSIEECNFSEKHTVLYKVDPYDIVLREAIFLKANESWYNLRVKHENVGFSSTQFSCQKSYSFEVDNTGVIEVGENYQKNYVIQSIMFMNVSNRV